MSDKRISGEQLVYLASTLAAMIAQEASLDDINILSSFFNVLGDSLSVIAAQRAACKSSKAE